MKHAMCRILQDEHLALAAVLRSLLLMLANERKHRRLPDFSALRAMLFYIDEFPEQHHHRKESELLFPRLRARSAAADAVITRLDADHAQGERKIRELDHLLSAFEMLGEPRREAFETAVKAYVDFYLAHMAIEEKEILPLAEQVLTEQDFAELEAAFAANRDPLTGHPPAADYTSLFKRIVNLVPAPYGLGPAR